MYSDSIVLLSTDSPSLCLQHVANVLAKQLSIVEVSSKITAVDESLTHSPNNRRHCFCTNDSLPSMPSYSVPSKEILVFIEREMAKRMRMSLNC